MTPQPTQSHRSSVQRNPDGDESDFTLLRRPITGDEQELSVSIGQHRRVTLRGGVVIGAVISLVTLAAVVYISRETDKAFATLTKVVTDDHRRMTDSLLETFRLGICINSLNETEKERWRTSANPPRTLASLCPGMLLKSWANGEEPIR